MQSFAIIKSDLSKKLTSKIYELVKVKYNCKVIIHLVCLLCLYALQIETKAQNLVQDSSFENYTNCPDNSSQVDKLLYWKTPFNHLDTANYYNECGKNNYCSVPNNVVGFEYAATGKGYVGMQLMCCAGTSRQSYNEYIQSQLSRPLKKGFNYKVAFKYSLADVCKFASSSFGICFTKDILIGKGTYKEIGYTPQLTSPKFLDKKDGWERIEFNYLATGGESYITIGNFSSTQSLVTKSIEGTIYVAFIFIDDVSVYEDCKLPEYSFPKDTLLCENKTLNLNVSCDSSEYLWQDGSKNSFCNINKEGLYWVNVTNKCGSKFSSVNVKYSSPPTLNLGNDTTICNNKILELRPNVQQVNYLWQDGKTDSSQTVTKNGIYTLKVSNFCGEANDSIKVNFEKNPTVKLGNDTILCDYKELLIQLPKKFNYVWQDNWQDTFYNITKAGLYKVTASNYCGSITDEIQVSFIDCSCTQYYIPNAFTPKNDGLNELFYPVTNCEPEKFSFSIYNRWGSEVFFTNNHKEKWDGKFNGKECQADVYFYNLNYQFPLSTAKSIKGTVTLLR